MNYSGEEILVSIHSQEDYCDGIGEDEIVSRVQEWDGPSLLIMERGAGNIYGEENIYDHVIEVDPSNSDIPVMDYQVIDEEVASVISQKFEYAELIGAYASQCVKRASEVIGVDSVSINSEATIDEGWNEGIFILADKFGSKDEIIEYVDRFNDVNVAGRIEYGGFHLDEFPEILEAEEDVEEDEFTANSGDEGVEVLT